MFYVNFRLFVEFQKGFERQTRRLNTLSKEPFKMLLCFLYRLKCVHVSMRNSCRVLHVLNGSTVFGQICSTRSSKSVWNTNFSCLDLLLTEFFLTIYCKDGRHKSTVKTKHHYRPHGGWLPYMS